MVECGGNDRVLRERTALTRPSVRREVILAIEGIARVDLSSAHCLCIVCRFAVTANRRRIAG